MRALRLPYGETADAKVLEMPYAAGDLSMVVVLPKENAGLEKIEMAMTASSFATWTGALQQAAVSVSFPRFEATRSFSLVDQLKAMGMKDAFIFGVADFSGMDGTRNLAISAVEHKAFVKVDEKGTEAAAATAVVMAERGMPLDVKQFVADHPFLFFLRDRKTGNILFIGRITNPAL